MRAIAAVPGQADSARLVDAPEPEGDGTTLLVTTLAIGICGTDIEIVSGRYGWAPPGHDRLILGHESLGRVESAPSGSGFAPGDLVVGIVRRPDPVPCRYCAAGEWDMCSNGLYTERGIKARDGYGSERFRINPAFAVKIGRALGDLGVLVEPASVVAKAWAQVDRIGKRASAWSPRSVLVTGAGPIGLLAALMGQQRGLEVHVFDRVVDGPKPQLVRDLGGTYHAGDLDALGDLHPDILIECTGAAPVVADAMMRIAASGVVCLTGVSAGGHTTPLDLGAVNRSLVLENGVVFGSVNANRAHYEAGVAALSRADRGWLSRLITRRVPLHDWPRALERQRDDVKVTVDFTAAS